GWRAEALAVACETYPLLPRKSLSRAPLKKDSFLSAIHDKATVYLRQKRGFGRRQAFHPCFLIRIYTLEIAPLLSAENFLSYRGIPFGKVRFLLHHFRLLAACLAASRYWRPIRLGDCLLSLSLRFLVVPIASFGFPVLFGAVSIVLSSFLSD